MTELPTCWWCGSTADSREHKFKAGELRASHGPEWRGEAAVVHGSFGGQQQDARGPKADELKWPPSMCEDCNNRRSQPFDRAQTGLTELYNLHMLDRRRQPIKAPLSPTGKTIRTYYSLTGPYAQAARAAARAKAARERQRRLKSSTGPDDQGTADPAEGQTATPAP
ncbi:hypothetical protein [Curtobacterium oceanosedimentum]|uniref:hypothetical protein n=1 Tax=Curtobacterium oceanosedimentum TaxID=465820 RepID=UPI00128F8887|nr:hypothetical protein [Curtobacterium oceanosedimentum]